MEMVMELAASRRRFLPWECIVRSGVVLTMIGLLCVGSRSYAKDCTAKPAGYIVNPEAGEHILSPKARECEQNARKAAMKLGDETGILEYTWKEDMVNVLILPDRAADTDDVIEERNAENKEFVAKIEAEELPVITELKPIGDDFDVLEMLYPSENAEAETDAGITSDAKEVPIIVPPVPAGDETKTDIPSISVKEEAPLVEEDMETDIPPVGAEDDKAVDESDGSEEEGAEDYGLREFAGFLVDEEGYIAGVTERVDLTDGILILIRDTECIGVREGALSELAGCVAEIYIPANIREIEPGAFDAFASAAYIEVAGDHPGYYSENGSLYPRE